MKDSRPALPVDGPHWVPRAVAQRTEQTDGRGMTWTCTKVEAGGRVLHWLSGARKARTEIVDTSHPDYPNDRAVAAWEREQKRIANSSPWVFYP